MSDFTLTTPRYPREKVYSRHTRQDHRAGRVFFYVTAQERAAIEAMRKCFGPVPLSQSLLVRTALATLQRILDTGYVPPIEDRLVLVDREAPAGVPTKAALALRLAAMAGEHDHADAA